MSAEYPLVPKSYDRVMSQAANSSGAVPTPDATILKRLGYVRLLHRQAITQSYAPAPLS